MFEFEALAVAVCLDDPREQKFGMALEGPDVDIRDGDSGPHTVGTNGAADVEPTHIAIEMKLEIKHAHMRTFITVGCIIKAGIDDVSRADDLGHPGANSVSSNEAWEGSL